MMVVKGVSILEKLVSKEVIAVLGREGATKMLLGAGAIGGITNSVLDSTVVPVVKKLVVKAKTKIQSAAEAKQREMLEKRAALVEEQAQVAMTETPAEVQPEEVTVEEKAKTSNKKKK